MIEDNRWRGVAARVIKGVCDDLRKNIVDDHREDGRNIAGRDIAGSTATVRNAASSIVMANVAPIYAIRCDMRTLMTLDLIRGLLLVAAVVVLTVHPAPDLEIDMIDVGQGDGIVVSANGHHMLIDGGSTSKNSVGRYFYKLHQYRGIL